MIPGMFLGMLVALHLKSTKCMHNQLVNGIVPWFCTDGKRRFAILASGNNN